MSIGIKQRNKTIGLAILASVLVVSISIPTAGAATQNRLYVDSFAVNTQTPGVVNTAVSIRGNQTFKLNRFTVVVRDTKQGNFDFPNYVNLAVTSASHQLVQSKPMAAGTYTAWLAFSQTGNWVDIPLRRTFTVAAASNVVVAPQKQVAPATSGASPIKPAIAGDWKLAFSDDFTGTAVDSLKWNFDSSAESDGGHGNKGNQQLEYNQQQNCSLSAGVLTETAKRQRVASPSGQQYDWTSCLLSSKYSFRYGYMEIRSQFPSPKGFWPGFWTWGVDSGPATETDAYEFYSDNHSKVYFTSHAGSGGECAPSTPFDPTIAFHTYGADIEASGTTFYIDAKKACQVSGHPSSASNVLIDNFVYQKIPPDQNSVGLHKVDWVRVWAKS